MKFLIGLILLGGSICAEEWECKNDNGCEARITEDGELHSYNMRKGDIVSTEAGWVVNPDDGWIRLKTKDKKPVDLSLIGIVPKINAFIIGNKNETSCVYSINF